MIYKTIPITERADGSLQIDSRNINLRQGDYNFKLQYSTYKDYSEYSPIVNVQVAFRRKDGQQTGWLPMAHIREKEYSINLKNTWFTKEAGILYMTFRVFQTNENNVQLIINTASASLPIIPIANWNPEEEDLLPSEFEVYMSQTNEKFKEVDDELSDLRNDLSLNQLGKGIFDNEQELLATYPNGVDYPEGTWAVLLSTNTVWLYNSTTKTWYNSGRDVTDIFDLDDNVYRFAKQLYEESANELYIPDQNITKNGITVNITNGVITANGTATANTDIILTDSLNIGAGQYSVNFFETLPIVSGVYCNLRYSLGSAVGYGSSAKTVTTTNTITNINFYVASGVVLNNFKISPMLVKGEVVPKIFGKFNPNRHITNSEAEFLKEEYNKSTNILNPENCVTNYNSLEDIFDGAFASGRVILTKLNLRKKVTVSLILYGKPSTSTTLTAYDADGKEITGGLSFTNINQFEINKVYTRTYTSFGGIVLWSSSNPTNEFSFRLWINEGETGLPYQPYNSSSHITNPQADFLKSEYEKSLNRLPFPYSEKSKTINGLDFIVNDDGTVTVNGTSTETTFFRLFGSTDVDVFGIELGSKFTVSGCPSGGSWGTYSILNGYTSVSDFGSGVVDTYNNVDDLKEWMIRVAPGKTLNNVVFKPMITKGDKIPSINEYQPYNGQIIHEKDIKPMLLWSFGQIDVIQEKQEDLTMLSREGYEYIIIAYQEHKGWDYVRRYAKFKMISSSNNVIVINDSISPSTMSSRRVIIKDNTTFTINEAYIDGQQNNAAIIIQEIYGSNY